MHFVRQKVQITFFWTSCSQKEQFVSLFWCIWQGKTYKWRYFLTSCSQKEQFCCPFLMHLARQKVQMTFFSRKMTFRKEQKMLFLWRDIQKGTKKCSFCEESHSSCSQKEQFFCPFLMHFVRLKVQITFFLNVM